MGILAEILELCRKLTAKTRIMYKTNMSHLGVQKFTKQLPKLELLGFDGHAAKYVTTEKGLEFIKRYAALRASLSNGSGVDYPAICAFVQSLCFYPRNMFVVGTWIIMYWHTIHLGLDHARQK